MLVRLTDASMICVDFFGVQWRKMMYASQINRRKALTCVDFLVFSGERCCMPVRSTDSLICVDFFVFSGER